MLVLRSMSWLLLAGVLALLLSMPISLEAQLTLALAALAVLAALYAVGPRTIARQLFIGVASVIIVKYLHWRITSTLPPFDSLVDFTAAVALLAAEIYSILALYLTMFVVIEPLEREPVAPARDAPLPTVDVFVPTYDESVDLVAHTLAAAKAMDYDPERVTVWLLDDGATDEKTRQADPAAREEACERKADLMEVCNRLGVRYLARPRNEMAKAGNLNFGLARASADLVAVLDADHAPRPDFLKKTVGHFQQDDGLFLVQTPHAFLNDDPVERNMSLARQMPAEHQMFYKALQKGLDSWNASYF
jgi:cellulose synthase (UDP-forming)